MPESSSVKFDQVQPGRLLGVICDVSNRDRGFVFVRGVNGEEYFAHRSAFALGVMFDDWDVGDGVNFKAAETPKGKRAFDIRAASAPEKVEIEEAEEHRGNR